MPHDPAALAVATRERANTFKEFISRPGFSADKDAQLQILHWIGQGLLEHRLDPADLLGAHLELTAMFKELTYRIGETPERILRIAMLPSRVARRRALYAVRKVIPNRLPSEEIFPTTGWLGAYLDWAQQTEVPFGWHFWMAINTLGAACRRNIYVDMGFNEPLFLNQFTMLVGPSGIGKNEAINRGVRLLHIANKVVLVNSYALGIDHRLPVLTETTAEALIDELMPQEIDLAPDGLKGINIQRLVSIGIVVNPEAVTLLGKTKESAERFLHLATDMYTGSTSPRRTRTRGGGEKTLGPSLLSMILGSTVPWIKESITGAMIDGGFAGRTLWIQRDTSPRVLYRDFEEGAAVDPLVEDELAKMLVPWMLAPEIAVGLSDEGTKWWRSWYQSHREAALPDRALEGYWARKPAHLRKIAAALAVSELCSLELTADYLSTKGTMEVGIEQMIKAEELLALEEPTIPVLFAELDAHPDAIRVDKVLEKLTGLVEACGGPITHSAMWEKTKSIVGTPKALTQMMAGLQDAGKVTITLGKRGGRQYSLTPTEPT